jgi:DNA-binding protein H-NS
MTIDIDSLSPKELDALLSQAAKRKKTLAKRKPVAQVRKKLVAAAKAEGYTIAELFGGAAATREPKAAKPAKRAAKKAAVGKIAPKYRNPANAAETWTGRGKPPRWLAAELAAGKAKEDFLIA